jgi:hypothetical protein
MLAIQTFISDEFCNVGRQQENAEQALNTLVRYEELASALHLCYARLFAGGLVLPEEEISLMRNLLIAIVRLLPLYRTNRRSTVDLKLQFDDSAQHICDFDLSCFWLHEVTKRQEQ